MATLRLFAALREIAGTGRVEVEGATVGAVLHEASRRFGPQFADGAAHAAVWVDGEPIGDPDIALAPGAEVALIPPVSGGAA